jgi:hypothetical protein
MIATTVGDSQIFSLPQEIFVNVISFLNPKNIARLLTVNTAWFHLLSSNDLWIKMCPRISVEKANEGFYLARYPDLTGINLAHNARIGNLQILKTLCGHPGSTDCMTVTQETIISGSPKNRRIHIWDRAACLRAGLFD